MGISLIIGLITLIFGKVNSKNGHLKRQVNSKN